MTTEWVLAWVMVMFRAGGLMVLLPTVSGRPIPPTMRVAFTMALATLLAPLVPVDAAALAGWGGLIVAVMGEIVLGVVLGWAGRFVFGAVEMASRVITNEIGLRAMPGMDVPRPDQEPIAALLMFLAGLLFFIMGAHHQVLATFARTFDLAPAGAGALGPMAPEVILSGTSHLIELALRMSAPFIALNFGDDGVCDFE